MATWQYDLAYPPAGKRELELWLQHAAGFIVFEDVRQYARERIDPALTDEARAAAQKGIDDAVYGLMMVIDGVSGSIGNASHKVEFDFVIRIAAADGNEKETDLTEIDLRNGDGMCLGYHGWLEGDFGDSPIVVSKTAGLP